MVQLNIIPADRAGVSVHDLCRMQRLCGDAGFPLFPESAADGE
jgi:hypothetical protein